MTTQNNNLTTQGIRWHDLDKFKKEELKMFFEMTNRENN
jgi:hypothetical protein